MEANQCSKEHTTTNLLMRKTIDELDYCIARFEDTKLWTISQQNEMKGISVFFPDSADKSPSLPLYALHGPNTRVWLGLN